MLDFSRKPIIGYVQLGELTEENLGRTYEKGIFDAVHLERGGADAIVVENYAEPERMAAASSESILCMAYICPKIRQKVRRAKLGINVLPADLIAALQLAIAYSFDFVHADIYADRIHSRETRETIQVDLEYISRFRREFASSVPLIATIKPWHAYDVWDDEEIEQSALRAVKYGADAVTVVGKDGKPPEPTDIKRVRAAVNVSVGAGSGINDKTLEHYLHLADFFLVSGFFKHGGQKSNPVDPERVNCLIEKRNKFLGI